MSRSFKNKIFTFLILWAAPSWASLVSKVDRSEIETDETLQLTVTYSGQAITGEPNFSVLKRILRLFQIANNSSILGLMARLSPPQIGK